MTFDEIVTTVTQDEIAPAVVDTVLTSNVLTLRLLSNPKPWVGETLRIPVKISASTSGGSFDGYDTFSTSRVNTRRRMSFDPTGYYQSVVISNLERAVNQGPAKVLDLVGVEMDSAQQDMVHGIGTLFYLDGTGNAGKDFLGLRAAVDDGGTVATYGGLDRAAFPTLQSSVTAALGNLTLAAMATSYNAATRGSDKPTLIVTTEAVWSFYEELLQPTITANYDAGGFAQVTKDGVLQNRGALKGEAGFDALYYRGTPIVKDEHCPAGFMYLLNENYLNWYSLPHPDNILKSDSGNIEGYYSKDGKPPVISWTGFKKPTNQDAVIGQFVLYGELINRNPNRSSVIQGITGV